MQIYLETDRTKLIAFGKDDSHLIKSLDSDPEVVKFTSNGVVSDDTEVKRVIDIIIKFQKDYYSKFGFWKLVEKDSDEFMGWFHLRPLKSNPKDLDRVELGYRLKKCHWGKGIATEVSRALIEKAFKELEVTEILAHAMVGNTSSINVMRKCNLQFLRTEINHEWTGPEKKCVWYHLKRNDF